MRSVEKIKKKFGTNAFRTWGKRGGSKYLLALKRGDKLVIVKKKSS
jgi:hypothetical protein